MRKILILFLVCFLSLEPSFGQKELSINTSLEHPLGEMSQVFNPGLYHQISVGKRNSYKNKSDVWGVTLGYGKLEAKADTFYYSNDIEQGYYRYSDHQSFQLLVNYRKDFIFKYYELFGGFDTGYMINTYQFHLKDPFRIQDENVHIQRILFAPKVGINFLLHQNINAFVQGKYTFAIGDREDNIFNNFLSPGVGLILRLN